MSRQSSNTRRIVIGGMVLAFLCCIKTETTKASCGDWLANHPTSPPQTEVSDEDVPDAPCSCRGPECRRVPGDPLPTSPDQRFSLERAEWAALFSKLQLHLPASSPRLFEGVLLIPQGQTLPLERPPRG